MAKKKYEIHPESDELLNRLLRDVDTLVSSSVLMLDTLYDKLHPRFGGAYQYKAELDRIHTEAGRVKLAIDEFIAAQVVEVNVEVEDELDEDPF